jgi:hypothetical protein
MRFDYVHVFCHFVVVIALGTVNVSVCYVGDNVGEHGFPVSGLSLQKENASAESIVFGNSGFDSVDSGDVADNLIECFRLCHDCVLSGWCAPGAQGLFGVTPAHQGGERLIVVRLYSAGHFSGGRFDVATSVLRLFLLVPLYALTNKFIINALYCPFNGCV